MLGVPTAADIIARLELKPHPEGGHFRETFRDIRVGADGRSASTAIYFLLARGERSHWHRIDAVEVWHYYAGSALMLEIADGDGRRAVRLGPGLAAGEMPQAVVPAQAWQAAESTGDWTLVGCTVAPGFDFSKFELAPKGSEPTSPEGEDRRARSARRSGVRCSSAASPHLDQHRASRPAYRPSPSRGG